MVGDVEMPDMAETLDPLEASQTQTLSQKRWEDSGKICSYLANG